MSSRVVDVQLFIREEALREALSRITEQRQQFGDSATYGVIVRTQVAPDAMTENDPHVGEVGLQVYALYGGKKGGLQA